MNVVIAGASGFVGKHLVQRLTLNPMLHIRALGRTLPRVPSKCLTTQPCDLYSLLEVEDALSGQQQAIYLAHSMLPSSELAQGHSADYDLILADNFARAAKKHGIERILYLGGIVPPQDEKHPERLSPYLRSRLEVEKIFRSYDIPLLALRTGVIVGTEGSSFQILMRLVQRQPILFVPEWMRRPCSPIHVRDVTESFHFALTHPELEGSFDLESSQTMTYLEMMRETAHAFGKKRLFLKLPFFAPGFSKLWLRLVTGAPKSLVYPLIESLQHNLSPDPKKRLRIPRWYYTSFDQAIQQILDELEKKKKVQISPARKLQIKVEKPRLVQSVQRFAMPEGKSVEWASDQYVSWLPRHLHGLIRVETAQEQTRLYLVGTKIVLLELTLSKERSFEDRILFYITGGILDRESNRGRLEFRLTHDRKHMITAVHNFRPRLPWFIYKFTQALWHAHIMKKFGVHVQTFRESS